jgi:peptidoglycan-N-acetylglucosamine deacetylase
MIEKTHTVCLTFDFDAMSLWIGNFGVGNLSMISRGEFGIVGVERLLALAKKHSIPLTVAVPGHTAYCYPDLVKKIHSEGHEIVHHGWIHENPVKFSRDEERRNLEKGFAAIEYATGGRPIGYRSPAWDLSANSNELLLEAGFLYDSSCMANDFYPYYLRKGDKPSQTEPYIFGELTDLVEVPVTWNLDDWPAFDYVYGQNTGLMPPSAIREIWQGEFDFMVTNCPGGVYTLTVHPQVIGRGHRLTMLDALIGHMKAASGTRFETVGGYVKRWKAANPREQWKKENPLRAGTNAYRPAAS